MSPAQRHTSPGLSCARTQRVGNLKSGLYRSSRMQEKWWNTWLMTFCPRGKGGESQLQVRCCVVK